MLLLNKLNCHCHCSLELLFVILVLLAIVVVDFIALMLRAFKLELQPKIVICYISTTCDSGSIYCTHVGGF